MAYVRYNEETEKHEVVVIGSDTLEFNTLDEAEGFADFVNGEE